jgi:hypothetical protein
MYQPPTDSKIVLVLMSVFAFAYPVFVGPHAIGIVQSLSAM